MPNDNERLVTAQWVLERNLAWIAAAEVKIGIIVAIDTAMLGGLAASFGNAPDVVKTACEYLLILSAASTLIAAIFCSAMAILPRTDGPKHSLVFFGRIAQLDKASYSEQFGKATDTELLDDWTQQIHRNAEIAVAKFRWVRRGMWLSFLSVVPWVATIVVLIAR